MVPENFAQYRKTFKKGEVLLREGDVGKEIVLPEEGMLEVYIKGNYVNTIDVIDSQDFIGEVGAILGVPRTATVVAVTDVVALCFPEIELESLLRESPSLGVSLIRSLCLKLHDSASHLADCYIRQKNAKKSAPGP